MLLDGQLSSLSIYLVPVSGKRFPETFHNNKEEKKIYTRPTLSLLLEKNQSHTLTTLMGDKDTATSCHNGVLVFSFGTPEPFACVCEKVHWSTEAELNALLVHKAYNDVYRNTMVSAWWHRLFDAEWDKMARRESADAGFFDYLKSFEAASHRILEKPPYDKIRALVSRNLFAISPSPVRGLDIVALMDTRGMKNCIGLRNILGGAVLEHGFGCGGWYHPSKLVGPLIVFNSENTPLLSEEAMNLLQKVCCCEAATDWADVPRLMAEAGVKLREFFSTNKMNTVTAELGNTDGT